MNSPREWFKRASWDDWNREHIGSHKVTVDEVEEVLANFDYWEPTYKDRWKVVGRTQENRSLTVIIGESPDEPGVYYVFSARNASRQERRTRNARNQES